MAWGFRPRPLSAAPPGLKHGYFPSLSFAAWSRSFLATSSCGASLSRRSKWAAASPYLPAPNDWYAARKRSSGRSFSERAVASFVTASAGTRRAARSATPVQSASGVASSDC